MIAAKRIWSSARGAIFHVWPDFQVTPNIVRSCATVKADAAQKAFTATGEESIGRSLNLGIDQHEHF
jgi:serine protease AprX